MGRRSEAIERFTEEAEASGLQVEVQSYPEGTRTAADAAAAVGCHVDQIVKSLVFMADVRPVLVLCSGGRRVDEERLASYLGTEIRIDRPDGPIPGLPGISGYSPTVSWRKLQGVREGPGSVWNGEWHLRVEDLVSGETGTLERWSLFIVSRYD